MTDISPLLYFYFWQPVYFLVDKSEQHFPGKSKELRGRWVGISEHIGNKMTYKIIPDDTREEVCRSAIRSALDPTMKNLREDPIEIVKDPISLEDILSPAEAISTNIKSDAMNEVQDLYFRKPSTETMEDKQASHFKQTSSPTPSTTAPKQSSTNKKQLHERVPKLQDLHPEDPTKVPHHYPQRGNHTFKSGQTLTSSDDDTHDVTDNLPPEDADYEDDNDILPHPPTLQHHRQSFSNSSSRHVTPISPISLIHLSISEIMGRMKILSGKNLKLLFKTKMAM
jgi:hypothetical protein